MTELNTGTYGAKRQSYRKASPRDLLKRLIEENARYSEKKLQNLFSATVREDEEQLDAIIEYWFANNYRSLVHKPPASPSVKAAKVAERTARVEVAKTIIKANATRMVLLDFVLPNGKPLRDATGKDCAKAGGWLSKIAASVKPGQKVGDVLSEAQVKKIFSGAV